MQRVEASVRCSTQASQCGDFCGCGAQALGLKGFNSCGTWAQLFRGVWDLAGPGIEPVSLALTGRFLTIGPPGRSLFFLFTFIEVWLNYSVVLITAVQQSDSVTHIYT